MFVTRTVPKSEILAKWPVDANGRKVAATYQHVTSNKETPSYVVDDTASILVDLQSIEPALIVEPIAYPVDPRTASYTALMRDIISTPYLSRVRACDIKPTLAITSPDSIEREAIATYKAQLSANPNVLGGEPDRLTRWKFETVDMQSTLYERCYYQRRMVRIDPRHVYSTRTFTRPTRVQKIRKTLKEIELLQRVLSQGSDLWGYKMKRYQKLYGTQSFARTIATELKSFDAHLPMRTPLQRRKRELRHKVMRSQRG